MNSTYQVSPNVNLDVQLSFQASSVVIDNNTNQWAYQPDTGRWIQPYSTANAIKLPATQKGYIQWQSPPGITQPTVNPGEQLTATFYDIAISQPSQNSFSPAPPQVLLAKVTSVANATTTFGPFILPTGAQGAIVVWRVLTGNAAPELVEVTDSTGNIIWGSVEPNQSLQPDELSILTDTLLQVPMAYQVDPQIKLIITEAAGVTHTFWIIVTFIPTSLGVQIQGSDVQIPVVTSKTPAGLYTTTADQTVTNASGQILAANASRAQVIVQNTGTVNIRLGLGATPTATSGIRLIPNASFISTAPRGFQGAVNAISETSANSTASVVESN
jgi:hypothetical protein